MILLYSILWKIQVVQKGRFLRENLGSGTRENQKFTPRTLPRLRGGLLKTRVFYPKKNIGSGQTFYHYDDND